VYQCEAGALSPEGRGSGEYPSAPAPRVIFAILTVSYPHITTSTRHARRHTRVRRARATHFSFATWLARLGRAPPGGRGGETGRSAVSLSVATRACPRARGRPGPAAGDPRPARGRRPARPPAPPPRGRRVPPPGPARRPTPRGAPTASNPPPGPEVFLHRYRNSLLVLPVRTRPHVKKVYRHSLPARATPAEERAGGPRAGSCTFRRAARG
jgi:hypothetical protein